MVLARDLANVAVAESMRFRHARIALVVAVALFTNAGRGEAGEFVDESRVAEGISLYDTRRFDEALAILRPAAEAGSSAAQYHLGLSLARGEGCPKDLGEAARWFERAATQGHGHSQYLLGHMYATGDGVAVDRVRAHMWFTAATAGGWWKAREAREKLVDAGMSPAEITAAGRLLRDWEDRRRKPTSP